MKAMPRFSGRSISSRHQRRRPFGRMASRIRCSEARWRTTYRPWSSIPASPSFDDLVANATAILAEIRAVTEQLHPERARSCRNAITMASVMIDEIRLRAPRPHARRARAVSRVCSAKGRFGRAHPNMNIASFCLPTARLLHGLARATATTARRAGAIHPAGRLASDPADRSR